LINTIRSPFPRYALHREIEQPLQQIRGALNARNLGLWLGETTVAVPSRTLWDATIPQNTSWYVDLYVSGFAPPFGVDDSMAAFYERRLRIKRTPGGGAVLVRQTTPVADDEDVAGWNLTTAVTVAGAVSLTVLGDRPVRWTAYVIIQETPWRTE
jgi:hypothetical protein